MTLPVSSHFCGVSVTRQKSVEMLLKYHQSEEFSVFEPAALLRLCEVCIFSLSLGGFAQVPSQSRDTHLKLPGDSKLAVGATLSVTQCLCPVMD